jgi:hypothetical protein
MYSCSCLNLQGRVSVQRALGASSSLCFVALPLAGVSRLRWCRAPHWAVNALRAALAAAWGMVGPLLQWRGANGGVSADQQLGLRVELHSSADSPALLAVACQLHLLRRRLLLLLLLLVCCCCCCCCYCYLSAAAAAAATAAAAASASAAGTMVLLLLLLRQSAAAAGAGGQSLLLLRATCQRSSRGPRLTAHSPLSKHS